MLSAIDIIHNSSPEFQKWMSKVAITLSLNVDDISSWMCVMVVPPNLLSHFWYIGLSIFVD